MGDVVAFRSPGRTAGAPADELAVLEAAERGDDCRAVLQAAGPLLRRLHGELGFAVMRDGLPRHPGEIARALLLLSRGLGLARGELARRPRLGCFGVYFVGDRLAWFEDGYGEVTGLAVPTGVGAQELAAFVRARVLARTGS